MSHKLDIYLIRHTKPLIKQGTCYGQLDCAVAEGYSQQLAKISNYFNHKKITAIYSSPLQRCALLAEDLAKQHINTTVIYKDNFKEINFGDWEGVKWDDIPRDKIDAWNEDRLNFQFPNGETPSQFYQRVVDTWSELIQVMQQADKPQKLLLVAHAGVIRALLCHCLHIPFQYATQLTIDYATISKISLHESTLECCFFNNYFK
ncbi:alpha-ribazole phosphatase [Psychromonas hadalis]|uniref:alpha-ribazole phosphatase n=1 Tax=Psychromonas hadalis TaxID=211669 RepID=UPI0003B4005C|nr:alpha-ribazole phosphatase [Psychromonas hadalis]